MSKETLNWKGTFEYTLKRGGRVIRDASGKPTDVIGGTVLKIWKSQNTLLDTGKTWAVVRLFDDHGSVSVSGTAAHYIYVGTTASGGAAASTDTTAAITWANGGQVALTYASGATVGQMSATATFVSATANGALTEAGLFAGSPVNAPTTGDGAFIARNLFAAVNKTSNDTLQVKYDVTIS